MNCPKPFLLAAASLLISTAGFSQIEPADALSKMKTADGLAVTLFASEPEIMNPTSIDVDAHGRVWVTEAVNYRIFQNPTERPEGDRIRVLEDTDGDGKCDKATTFWQDASLQAPLSIAVLGSRVYVCQSPELFYLEDTNNDGVADKKVVVLSGFKGKDHDHAIHGVNFGPDGLLYMSNGDEGLDVTDKQGNRVHVGKGAPHMAASVLRTDMNGDKIELLAEGLRNPLEPAEDSFGNVFISDNDDDGNEQCRIVYVMEGGNYGYWPKRAGDKKLDEIHWNEDVPGVIPKILKTGFGSPVGLTFYEGELMPASMQRMLFHADAGPGVVRTYPMKPSGAAFSAELNVVLSCPDDKWFRPVDVGTAPDGSIFVADWYDPGVGGHNLRDWTRGRIYRLAPTGSNYTKPTVPDVATLEGAIAAVASPNQATRFLGFQALNQNSTDEATQSLVTLTQSANPVIRARALWLLRPRGDAGRQALMAATKDADPAFRILGIRALAMTGTEDFKLAEPLIADGDAGVRRELLLRLQHIHDDWATDWIIKLAAQHDAKDRFYREAIGIASRGREDRVFDGIIGAIGSDWSETLVEHALQLHPPRAYEIAKQVFSDAARPEMERSDALRVISSFMARKATPESVSEMIAQLSADGPSEITSSILNILVNDQGGSWQYAKTDPKLRDFLKIALQSEDHRAAAITMIKVHRMSDFVPEVMSLAANREQPAEKRIAFVRAAGEIQSIFAVDALKEILGDPDPAIANEAAIALAAIGHPQSRAALEAAIVNDALSVDLRKSVVRSLGASKPGQLAILKIAEEGKLAPGLQLEASTVTNSSAHEDVRLMAAQVLPPEQTKEGAAIPPIAELMKMTGDAARGREVFYVENGPQCFRCHKINGEGREVGPDLSKIGAKLAREAMFESILNPSAAVSHEYVVWLVETRSKGLLNGYVRTETPEGIELVDANGTATKIPTVDIVSKTKSATSLMPTGLSGGMTLQQLADLVDYLGTLK